jgi:hypothetical protein
MTLPPALLCLRIPHRPWPPLWLPLFLLWPLLLLFFALAASCGVLVLCVALQISIARSAQLVLSVYALLCAVRGTRVDVVGAQSRLLIAIY